MSSVSNAILRPSLALAPKNSYDHQQHINKNAFSAVQFMFSNRDCHVNNAWYRERTLCSSCKRVCVMIPLYSSCLCNHVLLHLHHVFYCQIIHAVSMLISIALFFLSNYSDKWYLSCLTCSSTATEPVPCIVHVTMKLHWTFWLPQSENFTSFKCWLIHTDHTAGNMWKQWSCLVQMNLQCVIILLCLQF